MPKNTLSDKKYPAKLLLFGEYTALLGSDVLAMPLPTLYAEWAIGKIFPHPTLAQQIMASLIGHPAYIFDSKSWDEWIKTGGYLHSSVPNGYGLGSSGNLVAALFDAFVQKPDNEDLCELKQILGKIESYFHGSSSGVDPLISYTNLALLFSGNMITPVTIPPIVLDKLYLFDAKKNRNTEALVHDFKKKLNDPLFADAMAELVSLNQNAIKKFLTPGHSFVDTYKEISKFQFDWLDHLITEEIKPLWKSGLESGDYSFKLCGAGGGGFYLVYGDVKTLTAGRLVKV